MAPTRWVRMGLFSRIFPRVNSTTLLLLPGKPFDPLTPSLKVVRSDHLLHVSSVSFPWVFLGSRRPWRFTVANGRGLPFSLNFLFSFSLNFSFKRDFSRSSPGLIPEFSRGVRWKTICAESISTDVLMLSPVQ